jgi:hypothetical protein
VTDWAGCSITIARYALEPTSRCWSLASGVATALSGRQLAVVLPDLVDAVSPGGYVIEADELDQDLRAAIAADDHSAGAFGPREY